MGIGKLRRYTQYGFWVICPLPPGNVTFKSVDFGAFYGYQELSTSTYLTACIHRNNLYYKNRTVCLRTTV